jgi:RimJ/RimL family protein N-acetyltransferase
VIELIDCKDSARKVIFDPGVYADIAEDGVEWDDLPDGPIYLTGFVGNDIIGTFVILQRSTYRAEVHVQVIPKYREKWAAAFGRAVIGWAWANTAYRKLTAEIPVTHPNVLDFAERMGFEIEGVNRRSLMKGGKLVDQWYVGLLKEDA